MRELGEQDCELLGGIFAYLIQAFLGVCAVLSLVYKRHVERPQRTWFIWGCDVGKQLFGGFFVHFANIFVSSLLEDDEGDQCAWYFINFFVDCTFGVCVVYLIHGAICNLAKRQWGSQTALAEIGKYGEPPRSKQMKVWAVQLVVYLFSLVMNKVIVASLLYSTSSIMEPFGNWLFGPLQPNPQAELVVVMVLCPWLLTTLQFWLFDMFLKSPDKDDQDGEGLLGSKEVLGPDGRQSSEDDGDRTTYEAPSDGTIDSEGGEGGGEGEGEGDEASLRRADSPGPQQRRSSGAR